MRHPKALQWHYRDSRIQDLDRLTFECGLAMDLLSSDAVNWEHPLKRLQIQSIIKLDFNLKCVM